MLGVLTRYVICLLIVMSAVTGRTHVNWRYRTLRARSDSTMRCRLGLRLRSDQSVCVTDTDLPFLNKLIPSVQVQVINKSVLPEAPSEEASLSDVFYT